MNNDYLLTLPQFPGMYRILSIAMSPLYELPTLPSNTIWKFKHMSYIIFSINIADNCRMKAKITRIKLRVPHLICHVPFYVNAHTVD